MSNPLKKLKKNFKKILTVAVVVGAIYLAWPAITGAMSGAGAAGASSAATTAGTAAAGGVAEAGMGAAMASTAGGTAAAGTAAAGSGGLMGALSSGAAMVKGASPLVKMGLIQTGGAMLQGAMTPKPQTAAEAEAERLALYQSQPTHVQTYSTGQAGLVGGQAGQGYQNQFSAPQASTDGQNVPAPVARLNQETGVWERAS